MSEKVFNFLEDQADALAASQMAKISYSIEDPPEFIQFAQTELWIKHRRKKKIVRFDEWTNGQIRVGEYLQKRRKAKLPIFLLIHKIRQEAGLTTLCEAWILYLLRFNRNRRGAIIAHENPATANVYGNIKRFWQHMSPEGRGTSIPQTDRLVFPEPHDCIAETFTAGTPDSSRSFNFDYIHLSEFDFFPDPDGLMQALLPTFEGEEEMWDRSMTVESTMTKEAEFAGYLDQGFDPEDDSMDAVFLSWKDEKHCVVQVPATFKLTEREAEYQRKHNLTLQQMGWWRRKLKAMKGSWERTMQEWPTTSEEARLYLGGPVFDLEVIGEWLKELKPPIFRGRLEWKSERLWTIEPIEDEYGDLLIWKWPEPGVEISIGADLSYGRRRDYHDFCGLENESGEQCFHWRNNRISTRAAGSILYQIGLFYGQAEAGIEHNGPGLSVINDMAHPWIEYAGANPRPPYQNLYRDEKRDRDVTSEQFTIGFQTTGRTKNPATVNLANDITDRRVRIYSKVMLMQMKGYAVEKNEDKPVQNHKDEVSGLKNDDSVISAVIANWVRRKWIERRRSDRTVEISQYDVSQHLREAI